MQIKEVSEYTGLSAKSIRFYEEKGLIAVGRNRDNQYRNYSDEDVIQLKKIRVLRHLGLSVQEISDFLSMDHIEADALLLRLEQRTEEDLSQRREKLELIRAFRKDYNSSSQVIEEYSDVIDLLGDEDFNQAMRDIRCPSLAQTIFCTLILLGPIGGLCIHIAEQKWSGMWWAGGLSLLSAVFLVFLWQSYSKGRKAHRTYTQEKNRSARYLYLLLPLSIVLCIALVVCLGTLQTRILAPDGWLFYQIPRWVEVLMVWTVMLPVIYGLTWLFQWMAKRKSATECVYPAGYRFALRYRHLLLPLWLICLYITFITTTFVTDEGLIVRTPLHPIGTEYHLEEIQQVSAGFHRKGDFFYTVSVDGREITFSVDTANDEIDRYENDTYLWLEELDNHLMALGIPKTVDDTYASECQFNPQCIAHYTHIIENLPQ